MVCGLCGSGITAEEKYKKLRDGTTAKYVYYGCTRGRDRHCKNKYIREEELIKELLRIVDSLKISELGMKVKLQEEVKRFNKFQNSVLGKDERKTNTDEVNLKTYAKYLLKEGSVIEKRELLSCMKSRLVLAKKVVKLDAGRS